MASYALTSNIPFAGPSWHKETTHPYYKDSHRKLQRFIREYVDSEVTPKAGEWEEQGYVPDEAFQRHAQLGFLAAAVFPLPNDCLEGLALPEGIPADGMYKMNYLIKR